MTVHQSVPLGDVVDIRGGGTPSRGVAEYWGGGIPWATVKDFKSTVLNETEESVTELGVKNSATNVIPKGTVVIPTRMALGKAAMTSCDMAINQDLKALLIKDKGKLDKDYLLRFLVAKSAYLEGKGKGATVKGITLDVLRELEIPLPPLKEQKRIAAILDKADSLRRKRQQAIQLADQFLRAVFLDMFGDPAVNPKRFEILSLGDIKSGKMNNGVFRKNDEYIGGTPVAWVSELFRGASIDLSEAKGVDATEKEVATYGLKRGDIVFCRSSLKLEGIGFNNVYLGNDNEALFECHMIRMSPDKERVDPIFLNYQLRMENIRRRVIQQSKTVTMTTIDQDGLSNVKVICPPLEKQRIFSGILQKVESTKTAFHRNIEEYDALFNSASHAMFSSGT